ncbi:MAG: hypothetical protein ABI644_14950 [Arenimonas sp.]
MNVSTFKKLGLLLIIVGGLVACKNNEAPAASTDQVPAVSEPAASVPTEAPTSPAVAEEESESESPATIPDSADGIWMAIDKQSSELKATIDANNLKDVHHMAFAIRDLVAALPERSPTLSAEDKTKLESEVKFVSTLADRLDETGDAGDQAGSKANYEKLAAVLTGITRTK